MNGLRAQMKFQIRLILVPAVLLGLATLALFAERRPGYFANMQYLEALIAIEILIACLWKFEKVFFPVTLLCFLAADTANPLSAESFTLRWIFLAVGALVGFIIWMKSDRRHHFGIVHLAALFCSLAAAASASASSLPVTGLMKAVSLFLVFLYAATGGRVALAGREQSFMRTLVTGCEVAVFYISACYLVGFNMFGNPNNLGAFIGVLATPIMLWAVLTAETRIVLQRRCVVLGLCAILLYVSVCRAAIVADLFLVVLLTIGLRRPTILLRGIFAGALLLEVMAVANPSHMSEMMDTLSGRFVFKLESGSSHHGIFGSRQSPWEDSITSIKQHPWFGTGFGTSDVGDQNRIQNSSIYTVEGTNREHGSSYLAMAEYMGLLGILPFVFLLVLLLRAVGRVFAWMRRTGSPQHYAVPFALITIAGIIHAGFEDWLFAAGSYLCVFFWVSAFLLIDLAAPSGAERRIASAGPVRSFGQVPGLRGSATSV